MTAELIKEPETVTAPDLHEHSKQELIGRIKGMVYNGIFGFAAYFYHENPLHDRLRQDLDNHFGLPGGDTEAHTVIANGVILARQLQRHSLSTEPKADDSELVIGSYYYLQDATALDV